jgi:NAD(P)-dependent dehydrogenase (short-subunit alcohol dehydrogenase family)
VHVASGLGGPVEKGTLGEGLAEAVSAACVALGAGVSSSYWSASAEESAFDSEAAAVSGGIDLMAVDGASLFALGLADGGDGHRALRVCVDTAWNVTRAVVSGVFLPTAAGEGEPSAEASEPPARRGGRIVYLTPSPDAGEYADAARAGLENLARTLSIEWARHGITTVTIAPGAGTSAGEVAALTAYLASPAGAYFSGCLLDLRGP